MAMLASTRRHLAIAMRLPLLLACTLVFPPPTLAAPALRVVPDDHPTIQSAIDAAAARDIVLVAPGTYRECLRLRGRPLTLASVDGPARTIVDGGNACTVLTVDRGEDRQTLVEGFTLRAGSHPQHAGGVHVDGASPTLRGNVVVDNRGGRLGHGISLIASAALLEHNQVRANATLPGLHGGGGGGGIGVHGEGAVELLGNDVVDNRSALSAGGGLLLVNAGTVRIVGNRIVGNRARLAGAGIAVLGAGRARIEQNLVVGNALDEPGFGGGVHWLVTPGGGGPALVGNTIVGNHAWRGAGVHADGDDRDALVANNLIVAEDGDSAFECGESYDFAPPQLGHNLVHGASLPWGLACPREAARSQAPRFEPGSWRLAAGSPGIDAGDARASAVASDLAGAPRVQDGDGDGIPAIDLGAYESGPR